MFAPRQIESTENSRSRRIVDTNVSLFRWPFRRLPLDEPGLLVAKLRSLGIGSAWAGSFEAVLQRDVAGTNQRLVDICRQHRELIPVGAINLSLPGWRSDLRDCIQRNKMHAVRLHPNYHGYTLDDPRFREMLRLAERVGVLIQISVAMEDIRTQHSLVQVDDVDLTALPMVMSGVPGAKVQLLNARLRAPDYERLVNAPNVLFDSARIDGTDGLKRMMDALPVGRVLYGSHSPFLIPEAALIRVYENGLSSEQRDALLWKNAAATGPDRVGDSP